MRLADEFFLIAWDTAGQGKPVLHPQGAALGLAGALLGELILGERLTVQGAGLLVLNRVPVEDPLARDVLAQIVAAPEHTDVRTWLAYLAQDAAEGVGARLQDAGLVQRVESRVLFRTRVRYEATEFAKGAWPSLRLTMLLSEHQPMSLPDMLLAALVDAAGLLDHVLFEPEQRAPAREYLTTLTAALPPALRGLAGHVSAAVGSAVMTYRT
ncbi:GOLPH3/VPS74 family protein [Bailinhaonella thermotolerans]|uniref:GPP34 family phosphoprotein n=1 Tax=Bailinhaonella thermotolerans TaxID=1070861 RepID=A0A3A4A590_9ACTN|nr:GPP34 family phosphoprotein [Bailinhaonella thermotolerans]RJL23041.1 GPP34 family phosphoprotein [Bailinhaonella thermotolerans]